MFKGEIVSVRGRDVELKIERSRLNSTACSPIAATLKLNEAAFSRGGVFSSIIFLHYFRVKSVEEVDRERLEGEGAPNNGMHPTAN